MATAILTFGPCAGGQGHIARLFADAEVDLLVGRDTCVRLSQSSLCRHRTLHGIHCACELCKDTAARRVRDAAPVYSNELVENRAPFGQALAG